ncbi:multicopper oxidase family protein (plasmid) [Aliiroseovarius crassostreae]|uniref:Multicopper oxidase family protein n=1 Tax=Aliiroseovarius crassostreae TaxID=154981 RepID=A0A9Q9HEC0_9RHOB|nr:multicopper oxidase family protein [Aliiroseovarius crassostreae]UWP97047.1 multicopper oxidase family protein [Aliiroseovarius crassostreae]
MELTRRRFLCASGTASLLGILPNRVFAASDRTTVMTARVADVQLLPTQYPNTSIWGYDGQMPGPVIRVGQGERVTRRFVNELPQASSVHWHGIRSDNAMDGVAGLTQDAVEPGQNFDYDFIAPDAGTYWFHAHNRSVEQVARGLYGALIVDEPDAPDVDRDEVLVLDDWLLDPKTAQIDTKFEAPHDRSHAGRRGNFVATNGRSDFALSVKRNERLRLRLINAANARIFELGLAGLKGWVVAYDGMPLPQPELVETNFPLAPGQRIDLIVDVIAEVGETAHLIRIDDKQPYSQTPFNVDGNAASASRPDPIPLPPNPNMQISGVETAQRLRLNMEGGAMGRLKSAVLDGEQKSFRELVQDNQFWAFNGVMGMTDTPLAQLSRGETARLEIYNDTSFPHAMHLHGMHFRELQKDGSMGPLRDTLLMFGGETREIAFVADNPGKWLFHCHMLSHAASGMMTWIDVS